MATDNKYEVLRLLKKIENRLCVDCNVSLGSIDNIFGSITHGVWLCNICSETHIVILGTNNSIIKSAYSEKWSSTQLSAMSRTNNTMFNTIYERYIPNGWSKINFYSSREERNVWIKAKYNSKLFTIPQLSSIVDKTPKTRQEKIEAIKTLPIRIVDYFVVIGAGDIKHSGNSQNREEKTHSNSNKKLVDQLEFIPTIIDCFPEKNTYPDTQIPELLGPIVFPMGLKISNKALSPFSFSFVLTDETRVKLYGVTLIVYELLEPEQAKELLNKVENVQEFQDIADKSSLRVVYSPKGLTMLSHYPFYNLFARFLEQIYHTSLSAAPLPLERYITNFVKELPLPPQGRVEVLYSLPAQSILQISRPPPNRLPMVDFSYRPLFIFLSVDSILTIFTALCMEMTICVVAKNISVLTPVQEALLSFLYPFVWQGCYIPILPIQMIDILDAPVPLLVGISSEYFDSTPAEQRPRSVMFVDLDNDEIYQPSYDAFFGAGRTLPPIPKSKLPKLRKKLVEFGECIYRKPDQFAKLHIAGYPFNKNQHLRPIQSFTAEQGIIAKANVMGVSSTDIHSALAKSGIKKISDSKSGHAVPYRHPVACSLVFSSTSSIGYEESILDPKNNISDKDTFDAREIRDAFLRFFVASLIDYTDFIVDESDTSSVVSSLKSNKKRSLLNILHTNSTHNNSILNMTDKKYLFDIEAYGANQTEPFIKQLVSSQMFMNFIDEKIENPQQTEIKLFDESIRAKENRSKLALTKSDTPFLADETDYLHESYTTPGPSNSGIDHGAMFTYQQFPTFSKSKQVIGPERTALILIKAPEVKRAYGTPASILHHQLHRGTALMSSSSNSDKTNLLKLVENKSGDEAEGDETKQLYRALAVAKIRYEKFEKGIRLCQCQYRRFPVRRKYLKMLKAVIRVQNLFRKHRLRLTIRRRIHGRYAVILQKNFRTYRVKLIVAKMRRWVILLQSLIRMRALKRDFKKMKNGIIRLQAIVRGVLVRKLEVNRLFRIFMEARQQCTIFWILTGTSLAYRSQFWLLVQDLSYFNTSLYLDELQRLYKLINLYETNGTTNRILNRVNLSNDVSIIDQMNVVHSSTVIQNMIQTKKVDLQLLAKNQLIQNGSRGMQKKESQIRDNRLSMEFNRMSQRMNSRYTELGGVHPSVEPLSTLLYSSRDNNSLNSLSTANSNFLLSDDEERINYYLVLKKDVLDIIKVELYQPFGLVDKKKRKQTLVDQIWTVVDANHCNNSAKVVMLILSDIRSGYNRSHKGSNSNQAAVATVAGSRVVLLSLMQVENVYAIIRSKLLEDNNSVAQAFVQKRKKFVIPGK